MSDESSAAAPGDLWMDWSGVIYEIERVQGLKAQARLQSGTGFIQGPVWLDLTQDGLVRGMTRTARVPQEPITEDTIDDAVTAAKVARDEQLAGNMGAKIVFGGPEGPSYAELAEQFGLDVGPRPYPLRVLEPAQETAWAVLYPTGGWGATFPPHQRDVAERRAQDLHGMLVSLPVVADYRPDSVKPPLADIVFAETSPESVPADVAEDAVARVHEALSWALLDPVERPGDLGQQAAEGMLAKQVLGEETYNRIAELRDLTTEVSCPGCETVIRAPMASRDRKISRRTLEAAVEALDHVHTEGIDNGNARKASEDIQRHLRERAARKAAGK